MPELQYRVRRRGRQRQRREQTDEHRERHRARLPLQMLVVPRDHERLHERQRDDDPEGGPVGQFARLLDEDLYGCEREQHDVNRGVEFRSSHGLQDVSFLHPPVTLKTEFHPLLALSPVFLAYPSL